MLNAEDLVLCSAPLAHVPLPERLAPARNAGFAGLSLLPGDIWKFEASGGNARDLAARIGDAGLSVAEVDCIANWLPRHRDLRSGPFADDILPLTAERVIDAAQRTGARSVSVAEIAGVEMDAEQAAEAFAAICDLATEHGLLVHLEFLPFGSIVDFTAALDIVETAGRFNGAVTIDSWHFFRSGSSLAELAQTPAGRIGSVQLSDAPLHPDENLLAEAIGGRLAPGQGELPLASLVRTLDAIGSTAPIGVELFSRRDAALPIEEFCRLCGESTRALLAATRGDI